MEKEEVLKVYRHSLAHIMAKAVIELYGKEVQYAIGPEIEDGCYYDFVLPRTVTEEDFPAIEEKMHEIIKRREDWTRKVISKDEALELFKDQKFKTELIIDLPADETISIYYTGDDYVDLCRGPHVDNSQELFSAAFKIKNVSGAYWRGDEKRDQLQRIYLFAFPSKDELKAHLAWLKEAQERDHKKIGTALDLFDELKNLAENPRALTEDFKEESMADVLAAEGDQDSFDTSNSSEYSEDDIQVLEGLEAVRKRPGMYIGDTTLRGLHHLIYEIVANSVDEALAGRCDTIDVVLEKDGSVTVTDNGSGIPVGNHPKLGIPTVEVVHTVLHAGGKFGGGAYSIFS